MNNNSQFTSPPEKYPKLPIVTGIIMIGIGAFFLLNSYLKIDWLPLLIIPVSGILLLGISVISRRKIYIIFGGLLLGLGMGILLYFSQRYTFTIQFRIGLLISGFASGWLLITLFTRILTRTVIWWSLIPAFLLGVLGAVFLFTRLYLVDFVLYLVTALALVFLACGYRFKLIGLIIPGGILIGIGPGIYYAWGTTTEANPLASTGLMLMYFASGWLLISLFAKLIKNMIIWWPFIPGGIIAVTGFGLYLGGNPDNAAAIIGNAGSISIILFGFYLLLWRKGIKP